MLLDQCDGNILSSNTGLGGLLLVGVHRLVGVVGLVGIGELGFDRVGEFDGLLIVVLLHQYSRWRVFSR